MTHRPALLAALLVLTGRLTADLPPLTLVVIAAALTVAWGACVDTRPRMGRRPSPLIDPRHPQHKEHNS